MELRRSEVDNERMLSWVEELANGFGIPGPSVEGLLLGVRHALERPDPGSGGFDRVAITRRKSGFEVELLGAAHGEYFLVTY